MEVASFYPKPDAFKKTKRSGNEICGKMHAQGCT